MPNPFVLITGCSSGIGLAAAKALGDHGFTVIASARKADDVAQLQQQGLLAVQLDLADTASIEQGAAEALTLAGGRLYGLFNNGAYGQPGALEDLPTEALRAQFDTNLFGWHHLIRQILPTMLAAREGRIVQNSSVLGLVAMKYRGAYNASKFALEGYTDTLRLELEGSGVHISLIEPGPIDTRFRANAHAAFVRHIDPAQSRHQGAYRQTLTRLEKRGPPAASRCQAMPAFRHCSMHCRASAPSIAIRSPSRPGCLRYCAACCQAAGLTGSSPSRPDP